MGRLRLLLERIDAKTLVHAGLRGVVAAMTMSGFRLFSTRLGLLENSPPEMVAGEHAPEVMRRLDRDKQDAVVVLMHWAYGASGGAAFGMLPDRVRFRSWSGPVFGLLLWLGFESLLAPVLGLHEHHSPKQRIVLALDHLLYGAVLSEMRRRPQR